MLELRAVTGGWGSTRIVDGISFELVPRETISIVGRNGVGKTTLLDLIAGRADRHSGEILLNGKNVSQAPGHARARAGLAYVPQQREVFATLTVHENLAIAMRPGRWSEARVLELFPPLRARLGHPARHLSGGEQQMVSIARALIANPEVILMDEPTEGLAPIVIEQLVAALRAVVDDGSLALVLVEQRIDVALALADRCIVMDRGRIVLDAAPSEIRDENGRLAALMGFDG